MIQIKWILISFFALFALLILFFTLSQFFLYFDISITESNQLTSSISSYVTPQEMNLDIYVKNSENFKLVSNIATGASILIIKLPEKSFLKIEQEFNKKNIDSAGVNCKYPYYMDMCKIMGASEEAKIKIYTIKGYDELTFWVLYEDNGKLGIFSPYLPSMEMELYRRYMKAFNPLSNKDQINYKNYIQAFKEFVISLFLFTQTLFSEE